MKHLMVIKLKLFLSLLHHIILIFTQTLMIKVNMTYTFLAFKSTSSHLPRGKLHHKYVFSKYLHMKATTFHLNLHENNLHLNLVGDENFLITLCQSYYIHLQVAYL